MTALLALAIACAGRASALTVHAGGGAERSATDPSPLVQVPLVQPGDGIDPAGPPFLAVLRMRIDASGFVKAVRFDGPAPPDSALLVARARHWIWQPARDPNGRPIEAWATLRVSSRPGATVIDRPDEALGAVLGEANYASVSTADSAGGGWRKREVDPLIFANVFANWISDPHAYEGDDPWRSHCPPVFDATIVFEGPTRALRADLARGCRWMRVVTRDRILFVPYGRTRVRIDGDLAKVFSSPEAFAPIPVRR